MIDDSQERQDKYSKKNTLLMDNKEKLSEKTDRPTMTCKER